MTTENLGNILTDMTKHLDGVWNLGLSDSEGILIASWESPSNKTPTATLAGRLLKVLRTLTTSLEEIGGGSPGLAGLEEISLTTAGGYLVLKPILGGACFLLLNAPKEVPLGIIRLTMNSYAAKIEQALPGR